jgi:transposase InsO family protein
MPWKEANVLDLREVFIRRAMKDEQPFAALCREFGISPKTGYKWKQRFLAEGRPGLCDVSRRPSSSGKAAPEALVCELVRLKGLHKDWGPTKIRRLYQKAQALEPAPSLSTVKRILGKAGLIEPRRRRKNTASCGRISNRFVPTAPNQLWTVDFKGHWYSAARERALPLTVCDAFSRYVLLVQLLPDASTASVRLCFERLFEQYGLPMAIRSDNGAPFASSNAPLGLSRLSAWWLSLGISLDRIEPGHPEQNGSHERMHRNLALEIQRRVVGGLEEIQAALDIWREEFNQLRPHEALELSCPGEFYVPSQQRYDPRPLELEYPAGVARRQVQKSGCIKLASRRIMISTALSGWSLGLQGLGKGRFRVWFGALPLGELDLPAEKFAADVTRLSCLPIPAAGNIIQTNHYLCPEPKPLPMS